MHKRYVTIAFPYLVTDWMTRQRPMLKGIPFILYASERGRMVIKEASKAAYANGIYSGMVVADCRAIFPEIIAMEYPLGKAEQLLEALALWCIRFTPITAVDLPDGIILDCSGCTHLWEGEESYVTHILARFEYLGYHVCGAMSDTIASAWAVSRFGKSKTIVPPGQQMSALSNLPAAALRLEDAITEKLEKLGLTKIGQFATLPRPALRKRFGAGLLQRLDQVFGFEMELIHPIQPPKQYVERLTCLEPISTVKGIEIGLKRLLDALCERLSIEGKGLRSALFRCHRIDGDEQEIRIGTNLPSRSAAHLAKLFELKTNQLQPDLWIRTF